MYICHVFQVFSRIICHKYVLFKIFNQFQAGRVTPIA